MPVPTGLTGNAPYTLSVPTDTNLNFINNAFTQPAFKEISGLSAGSLNAFLLSSTDVSLYTYAMLALTGTWNLSLTVSGSNDNTNFFNVQYTVNGGNAGYFTSTIANNSNNSIVIIPLYYRFLQVQVTSYTSGTVNGVLELYTARTSPFIAGSINVGQIAGGSATNATYSATGNNNDPGLVVKGDILVFNGTTWDFVKEPPSGNGVQTRAGLMGVGQLIQDPFNAGNYAQAASATGDGISAGVVPISSSGIENFAGTIDRLRGNIDTGALINASGVTTTQTTADQTNYNGRGVKVALTTTAIGTGSITLHIQGKDTSGAGAYYDILVGAAVVTNTTNIYTAYPNVAAVANVSVNDIVPRTWRIQVVANNANAATYTVSANVIV